MELLAYIWQNLGEHFGCLGLKVAWQKASVLLTVLSISLAQKMRDLNKTKDNYLCVKVGGENIKRADEYFYKRCSYYLSLNQV